MISQFTISPRLIIRPFPDTFPWVISAEVYQAPSRVFLATQNYWYWKIQCDEVDDGDVEIYEMSDGPFKSETGAKMAMMNWISTTHKNFYCK